jgi:Na+/phosphate symporter
MNKGNTIVTQVDKNPTGTKLVEKYLQICDILEHILDNTDMFIEQQLQNVSTRADEKKVLHDFLMNILLSVQEVINYDLTV